jgi:hypothetical protein
MADKYITKTKLRIAPYNISQEDADDTLLGVLQDLTKSIIDNLCGQDFDAEGSASAYVEKKVSGTGKDTLFLPKRLVTLEKVRVYSSSTGYVDYSASNFTAKKKFISWNVFSSLDVRPRLYPEEFSGGIYNIGIFGIWGWDAYPEPIKYLQGRLIQKLLEKGQFDDKLSSERVGDFSTSILFTENAQELSDRELNLIVKQYQNSWLGYGVS